MALTLPIHHLEVHLGALLSNNSSPPGRPKNPATIFDALNFLDYFANEYH